MPTIEYVASLAAERGKRVVLNPAPAATLSEQLLKNLYLIGTGIVIEYFGYGFGFVGLTLFMMQQIAPGKHQMSHYAFASGIMNLGVMLPGMMSGFFSDWLGYERFFIYVLLATIPSLLITCFIPFTYDDSKKESNR